MRLTERNALQLAIFGFAFVPLLAGGSGMLLGKDMLGITDASLALDSHFRYLSGLLFGLGVAFWASIPRIEQHTARCRALTFIVVAGGFARLGALLFVGPPGMAMTSAIGMELLVTPALCWWQGRIARRFAA